MAVVTSGVGLRQWWQRQLSNGSIGLNSCSQQLERAYRAWRSRSAKKFAGVQMIAA
jgi:hypothetical protein